jgi:hypothetical protein
MPEELAGRTESEANKADMTRKSYADHPQDYDKMLDSSPLKAPAKSGKQEDKKNP